MNYSNKNFAVLCVARSQDFRSRFGVFPNTDPMMTIIVPKSEQWPRQQLHATIYRSNFRVVWIAIQAVKRRALSGASPETDGESKGNLLNFILQKLDLQWCFLLYVLFTCALHFLLSAFLPRFSPVDLYGFICVFPPLFICHFYSYEKIRVCFIHYWNTIYFSGL